MGSNFGDILGAAVTIGIAGTAVSASAGLGNKKRRRKKCPQKKNTKKR